MKKLLLLCTILAGTILLTGCSDSPKDVAVKWGKAIMAEDLKTANEYSTEKTKVLNAIAVRMCSNEKSKAEISETVKKWENGMEEINGDTAKVYGGKGPDKKEITLKKIDGKWKVDATKEVKSGKEEAEVEVEVPSAAE